MQTGQYCQIPANASAELADSIQAGRLNSESEVRSLACPLLTDSSDPDLRLLIGVAGIDRLFLNISLNIGVT